MNKIQSGAAVLVILLITTISTNMWAAETISEFATDFDGWQQQWHKESTSGTDGVASHSTEHGFLDGTSLKFDMGDGFGDDGTLWIEKQFAVSDSMSTRVTVTFFLFNEFQSDFNTFQVKSAIGIDDPDEQIDFETIGTTDRAQGWIPFSYEQVIGPTTDPVWIALGIRVAWETPRIYYIDRVEVTTTTVPEPAGAGILLAVLCGLALTRW